MNHGIERPDFPAGPLPTVENWDATVRDELIDTLEQAPAKLRKVVEGIDEAALDTLYKNWTIRQIVHHLADSHIHVYIRFKWTLTENNPTIKAYEEAQWVLLDDCKHGAIEPSLCLLDGLHMKWVQLLRSMRQSDFEKTFFHPQSEMTVSLWSALNYYPWHARHHTAQIEWLSAH